MKNKHTAIFIISWRKLTKKRTRTIITMASLFFSTVLLIGYGLILTTFINRLNDFNYITLSGVKSNGYFRTSGQNDELYLDLKNITGDISIKKSYPSTVALDSEIFSQNNLIISINDEYVTNSAIFISKGNLPSLENEIVLPNKFDFLLGEIINVTFDVNGDAISKKYDVVGLYDISKGNNSFNHLIVHDFPEDNNPIIDYYVYSNKINNDEMHTLAERHNAEYVQNPYQGMNVVLYSSLAISIIVLIIFVFIRNINTIYSKGDYEDNKKLMSIGIHHKLLYLSNICYTLLVTLIPLFLGAIFGILLYKNAMPVILSYTNFIIKQDLAVNYLLVFIMLLIIILIHFFTLNGKKTKIEKNKKVFKNINKRLLLAEYTIRYIKMSKSKYFSIILSLSLSIAAFVVVLTTTLSLDPAKHAKNNSIYDIQVNGVRLSNGIDTSPIEAPTYLDISDAIVEENYLLYRETDTGLQSYLTIEIDHEISSKEFPIKLDDNLYLANVSGIGEEYFNFISTNYNVEGEGYSNNGLMYYREQGTVDVINVGDKLTFKVNFGDDLISVDTTVSTIISNKDNDLFGSNYLSIFNFSSSKFKELFGDEYIKIIGINSNDEDVLNQIEEDLMNNDSYVIQTSKSFKQIIENLRLFLISFGILSSILLFINSLLNIICTQISNFTTRNKELAILETVGCSKKMLINILVKESKYYLLRSLFAAFFISLSLIFIVKKEIAFNQYWAIIYVLIYSIISTAVLYLNKQIILLNYSHINKKSITKRITE